jgi:hypothetical protein
MKYDSAQHKCPNPNDARGWQAVLLAQATMLREARDSVGSREARLIAHLGGSPHLTDPERYRVPNRYCDVHAIFRDGDETICYRETARMLVMLAVAEPEFFHAWFGDLTKPLQAESNSQYAMGLLGGFFYTMKWLFDHFVFPPSSDSGWMSPYQHLAQLVEMAGDINLSTSTAAEYGTWLAPAVKAYITGPGRGDKNGNWARHHFGLWKSLTAVGDWVSGVAPGLDRPSEGHVSLAGVVIEQLTCKAVPNLGWTGQAHVLRLMGHHLTDPLPRIGK